MTPAAVNGIASRARIEVLYGEADRLYLPDVDCRLLFLGDRCKPLLHAYEELARCFSENNDRHRLTQSLESSPAIQEFYEVRCNGKVSARMRDSIYWESGPLGGETLRLQLSKAGRRLVQPLSSQRLRALGYLWPLLRSNRTVPEIDAQLRDGLSADDSLWAVELLHQLAAGGFLEYTPGPDNPFLRPGSRPRVTFMGHTSLLLQSEQSAVLLDPLLLNDAPYARYAFGVQQLPLSAICCSHHHWDHCNIQTLLGFDKSIPVVIPRVERPSALNPPMAGMLRLLGFTDIREVRPWETIRIGDIDLTAAPFYGEQDEPGVEIDHYTYVLKTPGLTVYGGVDCYRDTFGEMQPVMERVGREYSPQVAFLPVSKAVFSYRYGGANGFCRYLDEDLAKQSFQYTAGPEDVASWLPALGARLVVPYAIFTFSRWTAPPAVGEFHEALASQGLEPRLYPLRPLDALQPSDWTGSLSSTARRKALLTWFLLGGRATSLHGRALANRAYRLCHRAFRAVARV